MGTATEVSVLDLVGIIAGVADNHIGIAGVAPHARLMALRDSLVIAERAVIDVGGQFSHFTGLPIIVSPAPLRHCWNTDVKPRNT